jgi:hypothetical protein
MPIMGRIIRLRRLSFKPRQLLVLAMALFVANLGAVPRADAFEHLIRSIVADDSVPACDQGAVLDTIRSKFETADQRVLKAGLALGPIDKIVQAYAGQNDPSPVARRYCEARATLNNGRHTTLYYLVDQDAGFAGVTWNVEFCLMGYEPWYVHDGRCHTVRHRWW